jgi:hypothetical protein
MMKYPLLLFALLTLNQCQEEDPAIAAQSPAATQSPQYTGTMLFDQYACDGTAEYVDVQRPEPACTWLRKGDKVVWLNSSRTAVIPDLIFYCVRPIDWPLGKILNEAKSRAGTRKRGAVDPNSLVDCLTVSNVIERPFPAQPVYMIPIAWPQEMPNDLKNPPLE